MEIENLNQALAVIENSLKKIDSARVQVEKVTESGSELSNETRKLAEEVKIIADIIKTETSSVITLFSITLKELDQRILSITEKSQNGILKGIDNFQIIVNDIESVSNKSIIDIKTHSINTIQNQEIYNSKVLNSLSELIKVEIVTIITQLENQVVRLADTDYISLFGELQKIFIKNTSADLEIELKKFDEKSLNIQSKIDSLQKEVDRLDGIDLEKHFDNHQKKLSDIFGAVNSINLTLINITQSLSGIYQSLNSIESTINLNFNEINQQIISNSKIILIQLTQQNENSKKNVELFDNEISLLSKQNELLKRELKTNKIIQIIGFITVVFTIIFIAFFKSNLLRMLN